MTLTILLTWFTLTNVASVASVIGLGVTLYILFAIRYIKRHYKSLARVPALRDEIKEKTSEIVRYQGSYTENIKDIDVVLATIGSPLKSLRKKIELKYHGPIKSAIRAIAAYRKEKTKENIWQVYLALQEVLSELRTREEDNKWEA